MSLLARQIKTEIYLINFPSHRRHSHSAGCLATLGRKCLVPLRRGHPDVLCVLSVLSSLATLHGYQSGMQTRLRESAFLSVPHKVQDPVTQYIKTTYQIKPRHQYVQYGKHESKYWQQEMSKRVAVYYK